MKREKEYRVFNDIKTDEESRTIHGFIPYNSASEDMGFIEYIEPHAFDKTLAESKDIKALFNHEDRSLLARTKNGSLRFNNADDGLSFEFEAPNTTLGNDVLELVRSGLASGISFGFQAIRDEWSNAGQERHLKECRLFEVSVLASDPAYSGTQVYCRSLSEAFKEKELNDADRAEIQKEIEALTALLPKENNNASEPEPVPSPEKVAPDQEKEQPQIDEKQLEDLMARLEKANEVLNRNYKQWN